MAPSNPFPQASNRRAARARVIELENEMEAGLADFDAKAAKRAAKRAAKTAADRLAYVKEMTEKLERAREESGQKKSRLPDVPGATRG